MANMQAISAGSWPDADVLRFEISIIPRINISRDIVKKAIIIARPMMPCETNTSINRLCSELILRFAIDVFGAYLAANCVILEKPIPKTGFILNSSKEPFHKSIRPFETSSWPSFLEMRTS